jgi:H+-translocating NAD(P) transhydrogenase subunit alpha
MSHTVGVPVETMPGERRVALCPDSVPSLVSAGFAVRVQAGAGLAAGFPDQAYEARGATIAEGPEELRDRCDVLAQVNTWSANPHALGDELEGLDAGQMIVGLADPFHAVDRVARLADRGVTAFGLELIPRITRAQSMDVLSSMATLTGYRAVIVAAERLSRCFPMWMTAAGTVRPARVFVIGAGVAGLQAIATAKRLGAVVRAYDVRPEVRDQVESVGGRFVSLELSGGADQNGYATGESEAFYERQRARMAEVVAGSDVVITTALIPGRPAPRLIDAEMVQAMEPGSVIVDLAAARGGNCALSRPDAEVIEHDVTILGPSNLAAQVPYHASRLYSNNLATFLRHAVRGREELDLADEIVCGTLLCRDGAVVHPQLRSRLGMEPLR